jgi:hypothetical protein
VSVGSEATPAMVPPVARITTSGMGLCILGNLG